MVTESKGKRGFYNKVYSLGGNRYRLEVSKTLRHYLAQDGKLREINLNACDNGDCYYIDRAPYTLEIHKSLPQYHFVNALGVITVNLISIGGVPATPKQSMWNVPGQYARWINIAPHTDYIISPMPSGVETWIELKNANAAKTWQWFYTGATSLLVPIKGFDAEGNSCELTIDEEDGLSTVTWNGLVTNQKHAQGGPRPDPVYPVKIDPTVNTDIAYNIDDAATTLNTLFSDSLNDLLAGYTSGAYSGKAYAGFRFRNIVVPNAASITSATLGVYVRNDIGSAVLNVYGDDQDDADTWSAGEIKGHTPTTAVTAFNNPGTGSKSIDVTAQVQEIVDRAGWVSGNNMRFSIRWVSGAGSNYIIMDARERSGSNHATLSIEYVAPSGSGGAMWF